MALRYKLGRGESCSLTVEDDSIAIEHAVFFDFDDHLRIEDVSHNGTFLVRKGIRRRLSPYTVETLQEDDLLTFGFYEYAFVARDIHQEIKKLRLPVGSQKVRCQVHGVIYLESKQCPLCPK